MASFWKHLACLVTLITGTFGLPDMAAASPDDTVEKLRQAAQLVEAGKPDEAVPIYRQLATSFPAEPSFRLNLAIAQYKAHHYREGVEECRALLKLQPEMPAAWLFLGASQLELGETASAAVALEKAVDLIPSDRNARLMLADALLAQERYSPAAAQFEQVAQWLPDNPRVWYGLELSYEGLATVASDRLESIDPGSAEFLILTGDFELERSQFPRALQRYRLGLASRPGFPGVHESVALVYERTGHTDWAQIERRKQAAADCEKPSAACELAAGHCREVAAAPASTPEELYWQAKAFLCLSRQARERLQKLPPCREQYEAAARVAERTGQWPEAAAAWKAALKLSPGNVNLAEKLALALCRNNDCASALPVLQDAVVQSPSSAEVNFLYGLALSGTQNAKKAVPYLEAAVRLDGNLLDARAALGEAYLEAGEPGRAIPQLEKAAAEDSDGSRHYQLARAYQSAGMQEPAVAALREYRNILRRHEAAKDEDARITPP